jgi:hypothetical protein
MPNAFITTAQSAFANTGLVTLTSAQAYDAAVPTATAPSTTSQSSLILSPTTDYPSLLHITPFASNNNFTAVGVRVVGWTSYTQVAGTNSGSRVYVPTVLADLTMGYTGTAANVPKLYVDSDTVYYHFFSSVSVGASVPTVNVYSPATAASTNIECASAIVDLVGSQWVTLQFKATGTTPKVGAFCAFI